MNKIHRLFILAVLVVLVLTACQGSAGKAPVVAKPEAGKANLVGRAVNTEGQPHANITVRLAEVFRGDSEGEGAYVLDTAFSPGAVADAQGYFVFQNLTPGEYVLVIGDLEGAYEIITDDANKAKTHTVEADKTLDVGVIKVDLP